MLLGQREIAALTQTGRLRVEVVSGTDHIFAPPEALNKLRRVCVDWLARHCSGADDRVLSRVRMAVPSVHLETAKPLFE